MKQHGYGIREKDWTFDNLIFDDPLQDPGAIGCCRDYVDSFRFEGPARRDRSLLIRGATGCGKTCLAVAMFKDLLAYGCDVEFWSTLEWLGAARGVHGKPAEAQAAFDAEILILDDLGTERDPDSICMLYEALYPRVHEGRPTIITAGMSYEQIEARYGAWFIARLREDFAFIELRGRDRRTGGA